MTDNVTTLPSELNLIIASNIDDIDKLERFIALTHLFAKEGSELRFVRPLYHSLRVIDNKLPEILPNEGAWFFFKNAFDRMQARQEQEIVYLTRHHPTVIANPQYAQVLQDNIPHSLESLSNKHTLLNDINSDIIIPYVNAAIGGVILNLGNTCITRLPVTLFTHAPHVAFWNNLTHLYCRNNLLAELNVQGLPTLQSLHCYNNQLTTLNVQGLITLRLLYCEENQLTTLNVQGLAALEHLLFDERSLTDLNLSGVHPNTKRKYGALERNLLFNQLRQADSMATQNRIIARLGSDYTLVNRLYNSPTLLAYERARETAVAASDSGSETTVAPKVKRRK